MRCSLLLFLLAFVSLMHGMLDLAFSLVYFERVKGEFYLDNDNNSKPSYSCIVSMASPAGGGGGGGRGGGGSSSGGRPGRGGGGGGIV